MKVDLERMHIRGPAAFMNKLIIPREGIAAYAGRAPLHTDDNALLEYSAPKAVLERRFAGLIED